MRGTRGGRNRGDRRREKRRTRGGRSRKEIARIGWGK